MTTFFFAPESPRPLALVRIGAGLVLLYDAVGRWPYAVELYSTAGVPMPMFPGTSFEPPALGPATTVALYGVLLFALAAVAAGWQTGLSLGTAAFLWTWFGLLDSPGTFKKYSVIGLHLLVLLSFSRAGAVWSIDALLRPDRGRLVPLTPAWPRRLMQILLCSIYLGAAVTKIRLPDFAAGDLLMFSLLDDVWGGGRLGMWLATQPKLLVLASFATVLFEIAFPLLVWARRARWPLLALAGIFHVLMGTLLFLHIFSALMLVALAAFLDERDWRCLTRVHLFARERLGCSPPHSPPA